MERFQREKTREKRKVQEGRYAEGNGCGVTEDQEK